MQIYEEAVNDQPWSFLFINLKAPKEKMFSIRFDDILQIENGLLSADHVGETAPPRI